MVTPPQFDMANGKGRAAASVALLLVLAAVAYQLLLQPGKGGRFMDL